MRVAVILLIAGCWTGNVPEPATPAPGRVVTTETTIEELPPITFAPGGADLDPSSNRSLDAMAETLAGNLNIALVEIGGHVAPTSAPDADLALAHHRAVVVLRYLVGKGIDAARLTAKGYPPDPPGKLVPDRISLLILKRGAP